MTTPDWLEKRHGNLAQGLNHATLLVLLDGHPQYKLVATPSKGQFTCAITQTINGKRLDKGENIAPSIEVALQAGLNELRDKLGW